MVITQINILIRRYLYQDTIYYSDKNIYTESFIYKLPGVRRAGRPHSLLQPVPGMQVALWQVRRRAGISGQTPPRGSPRPLRLRGWPDQALLHLWALFGSSNHPILRYDLKGEVGYHVGPLVQKVAAIVNSQGSPNQRKLHGHRTSPER